MKGVLAILSAALMLFSLIGCGATDRNTAGNSNTSAEESVTDNRPGENSAAGNNASGNNGTQADDPLLNGNDDTNGSIAGDDNAIGDDILTDDITPDDVTGIAPEGALSGENSAGTTARNRGVSKGTAAAQTSRTSAAGESLFRVASFDQMIRNAKVHDEDGNLTDLENSITPGIMH